MVGLPAVYFLTTYGCGEAEDRLAEAMVHETVLGTAPEGADRASHDQGCDEDDRFVVVGTRYRYDGSPGTVGDMRQGRGTIRPDVNSSIQTTRSPLTMPVV